MAHRVLVDVNVCLDLLLDRQPFVEFSGHIFELAEQNKLTVVVSGLSFDTLFYIMRPSMGATKSTQLLETFSRHISVGTVNQSVVQNALQADWKDLEDALQYYCSLEAGCNMIITRNTADFTPTVDAIPILTPRQFLEMSDYK
jgi:predicted nucleic acid-binding protein